MAQSNATQTFVCALTGTSPLTDPVVTPSGYICSRKLLLTKLAENGGSDPFDSSNNPRQLDESTLIELSTKDNGSNCVPPRPPTATSLPSLLGMVQNEFDAVLLELYDTRKALEETRRELSSALYQNDAAVRVVARIVKERDEARSKLEEFLSSDAVKQREIAANNNKVTEQQPQKRGREEEDIAEGGGATAKKAKTIDEEGAADALSRIPSSELSAMTSTWKVLTKGRKAIAKLKRSEEEIAKNEKVLSDLAEGNEKKVNLGKSSAKAGVLCIKSVKSGDKEYIITGSHDKTAIVYNVTEGKIVTTLSGAGGVVNVVDAMAVDESILVATGSADGMVTLCSVPLNGDDSSLLGSVELAKGIPVQVTIHPSSTGNDEARILVASSEGSIELYKSVSEELKLLSRLESEEGTKYTSGCLHPDGLIYIAGTVDGSLVIWDLKSSAAAGTMKVRIFCIFFCYNHVGASNSNSYIFSHIQTYSGSRRKLS